MVGSKKRSTILLGERRTPSLNPTREKIIKRGVYVVLPFSFLMFGIGLGIWIATPEGEGSLLWALFPCAGGTSLFTWFLFLGR